MYKGKIIDCRLRPPSDPFKEQFKAMDAAFSSRYRPIKHAGALPEWLNQTVDDFVKEMKELNTVGVMVGRARWGSAAPITNDHIKELVDRYPGMFIPIGCIDYTNLRQARQEIRRVVKWGFKGISFSTGRPGDLAPDDRMLYPIYQDLEELALVCYIVTSPMHTLTPSSFDRVAADFPGLRIFLAHGGYPYVDELMALVWRRPNIWYSPDCYSLCPGAQRYVEACNYSTEEPKYLAYPYFQILQDRYCYGSAIPYSPPLKVRFEEFMKLGWKPQILEKLLYKNAAELFRLETTK